MKQRGTVIIELIAFAPLIALFMLIITQFAAAFHMALRNIDNADAEASRLILEYEMQNANQGFRRPCIKTIEPLLVRVEGQALYIGSGGWRREFNFPQEVIIANQPICQNQGTD